MALPIVAAASGVIARFVPQLATRFGVQASAASVLNFAKQNPGTFLLAAKEVYDQGVSLLDAMMSSDPVATRTLIGDPQVTDAQRAQLVPADPVKPGVVGNIDQLADELADIQRAINIAGSFEGLQVLRRVFTMNDEHFEAYLKLKRLGTVLR